MSNDLKLTLRFDAENKQFIGQVKAADVAVGGLGSQAINTGTKMRGMASQSNKLDANLSSLRNQVVGLAGGFSALAAAQQASERLGQYQDIRTRITALVGSQEKWIETEQYLTQVSDEHNKSLLEMAGNYARVASLEDAGLITKQQTIDIFEGMSNAASTYGASNEQLNQSMFGLQQAMASQIVRAEELNQTTEPLPGLLVKMDRAAGLASGGFRKLVNDGKVTSEFFANTLVKALASYEGAAEATTGNVKAMYNDLSSAYTSLVAAYEAPISDGLSPVLLTTTEAFKSMADNAELVSTVVGVTLYTALGRGAAAAVMLTREKLALVAAERLQLQSTISQTQATVAATAAEVRSLHMMQLTNNQKFRAIGGEKLLAAARAQLAASTEVLSAAQARASVTGRALFATMGLLGGPMGIAMMAAGALVYFGSSALGSQKPTRDLKQEVSDLVKEFTGLNEAGRRVTLNQLGNEASIARTQLIKTQASLRTLKEELAYTPPQQQEQKRAEIAALERDAKSLSASVELANKKFAELLKSSTDGSWKELNEEDPEKSAKANESALTLLSNLQRQVALYGQTSEAAKVRYDTEHGALKEVNAELKKKLILEAEKLDAKKPKDTKAIDAFYEESDELNTAWQMRLAMQADKENQAKIQEQYAYEARKAAMSQSFQAAYEQAAGNQTQMDDLEREWHANRELMRAEHEANLTQITADADDERKAYQQQVAMDTLSFTQQQLSITTNFLKQSGEEQSGMYRTLFAIQKMAAIPSMIIATHEAANKALTLGPIAGPIASASIMALGYSSIGIVAGTAFAGQAHDGINRVPQGNEGTWMLKANEMVLNPKQADSFRWMVTMMQQMKTMQAAATTAAAGSMAAGGMPVSINVTGVDKNQVKATAQMREGKMQIDMMIDKAVTASMAAMYDDADNGGPVSNKLKGG